MRAPWTRGGPKIDSITERHVANVRVRFYQPRPGNPAALIYLHGGGWTTFSLDTHDRIMREYASRADVTVIGVDYALAPESKFPVALEQIVDVAQAIDGDYDLLAIGGDSSGANLALATTLVLRDRIGALVLNYGAFDRHSSPQAREELGGPGSILTAGEMEGFWRNYLRDESDAKNPLACPLHADLRGLPRTLLVVPEFDLLSEQSLLLAERLHEAGVNVRLKVYRGAVHSFLEAVSIAPLAQQAFDDTAKWLRTGA